jgi:lantibiotic modifying enzyme
MSSDAGFLEAAASIGRHIVSDAVWDDGRCSWMGATDAPGAPRGSEYRPLDATLYRGTAGVGVFLARLAAATGDADARRAALGAIRHGVSRAASLPPGRRDGFHAGPLGVAWAAAEAASILDAEELREGARAVLDETGPPAVPARCPDVVLGAAGAALALLSLASELGDRTLVERAVDAGETLLGDATVTQRGWSWATPGHRWPQHLCGVTHGAGGIGWALVELFAATGDERFRAGAEGAFSYERSWLVRVSGMWPDLRVGGQRRGDPLPIPLPSTGTWCHGEAGIALSRLRAVSVLGPGPHRDDAETALEATHRHLADALPYAFEDLTLCHGAAGAADALLAGADALGGGWHEAAHVATDLGRVAIDRYAGTGDWPCDVAGTTPALFRGLSGIGWFFLRLHDRTTPSPLLLPTGG